MVSIERAKGRLTRLCQARQKDDLTKERLAEYETSYSTYLNLLIAQIGAEKAAEFIQGLDQPKTLGA